jgi:predicted permease
LIQQLLTESLVVAIIGGILGIGLAWAGTKGILAMVPQFTIPDEADVRLNLPVLAFAAFVSMATSILFGLLPALQTARQDVVEPLKAGGRTGTSRRESWLSSGLVVTEVGLCLMLLVAAALMIRSLARVTASDYGVDTSHVLVARIPLDPARYATPERRTAFATDLVDRLKNEGAINSVAINTGFHPFGNDAVPVVTPGTTDNRPVTFHAITADYPRVFRIPLRRGRLLDESDVRLHRPVAVVSESFVQRYLAGANALGSTFRAPRFAEPPYSMPSDAFEIVGVVADTTSAFSRESPPEAYIPFTLAGGPPDFAVVARPKYGEATSLVSTIRAAVSAADKDQPVMEAEPVDLLIARFVSAGPKFNVVLFSVFGVLGLALATVGIYGVIASAVARRTREIGVRMALGATMADVMRLVVAKGARLIAFGIVIGLCGAIALGRYLESMLEGGSPYDPLSIVSVVCVLALTGIAASCVPARRAARIPPADALRAE